MATISLRCKHCDGVLDVNDDQNILFCPYCGSKELVLESDVVKVERMRTNVYRDVELGKAEIERQMKLDKYEHIEKRTHAGFEKFKNVCLKILKALFIIFICCCVIGAISIKDYGSLVILIIVIGGGFLIWNLWNKKKK